MTKALAAVSAAIDLAQGVGNPVNSIAAVRDLANECEANLVKLSDTLRSNNNLHSSVMQLEHSLHALTNELRSMYDREARRFPSVSFNLSRQGPQDDIHLYAMQSYKYAIRLKPLFFISTDSMEEDFKEFPKLVEHMARAVAQKFEQDLVAELKAIKR